MTRSRVAPKMRGRRLSKSALAVLCALAATSIVLVFPATSGAELNSCSVTSMQTPHYSTGAGGVIAKATWACSFVPTTIRLYPYALYLCPSQPPQDETWIVLNCTQKGQNTNNISITQPNTNYTRYVPPSGLPGAHGAGWWTSCVMWDSVGPNGTSAEHLNFSASVYIDA